jgi:prepilin peptidase CpaA
MSNPNVSTLTSSPAVLLVILVIAAAVIDMRSLRIPNWLTVSGMLLGLAWNTALGSPFYTGFLWALAGLATGLAMLLPLYVLKVMGAGDVKLMAMVGAFLGFPEIVAAVLFTFIAGGVAALIYALVHRSAGRLVGNVLDITRFAAFGFMSGVRPSVDSAMGPSIGRFPYGISIAAGTIAWLAARHLGFV